MTFPCAVKSRKKNLIVIFSEENTGTVVRSELARYPVGYTSRKFRSPDTSRIWEYITADELLDALEEEL